MRTCAFDGESFATRAISAGVDAGGAGAGGGGATGRLAAAVFVPSISETGTDSSVPSARVR